MLSNSPILVGPIKRQEHHTENNARTCPDVMAHTAAMLKQSSTSIATPCPFYPPNHLDSVVSICFLALDHCDDVSFLQGNNRRWHAQALGGKLRHQSSLGAHQTQAGRIGACVYIKFTAIATQCRQTSRPRRQRGRLESTRGRRKHTGRLHGDFPGKMSPGPPDKMTRRLTYSTAQVQYYYVWGIVLQMDGRTTTTTATAVHICHIQSMLPAIPSARSNVSSVY